MGTISGKHLNQSFGIELDFSANTSKAKKEIQDLQKSLNEAINAFTKNTGTGDSALDKQIREASTAAMQLKRHLQEATNVQTGKLDLSALNKSFKDAGRDLSYFRKNLANAGPEGKAAFKAVTDSILKAEVPLRKTNALLQEFGVTLKNTARWQISSSILHGFMGSIQTAYHYAEDLNKSLNNIRIVTGQNTDQMAAFAKQANESAKALSTTTTKYTDAALIYYQQGLDDKQVKERTDVTVKMANVARESAEEVSNQMTAVWNNFNKNQDEAVESFADKMTALGAATASSTSEIAEGLSKFAGIADTIGLSFDYATSALATVTATSRESADVVGTAFKTIFARMEGLKQGKTDEDGTDLNKYSQGLAKIGVQIKDQSGALKSMDEILDETGEKWQNLSRDEKIATAQTVAGVRQYNQLMTLMDNWDFFQKNLATAQNSEGTLQEQADIYAESWEAARDRVTAAAEEIYSQLLNDDFFIDLNNAFAGFLGVLSDAIDGLGGLKGVLLGIGALVTNIFGKQIAEGLTNTFSTSKARMQAWVDEQDAALDNNAVLSEDSGMSKTQQAYEDLGKINELLVESSGKLNESQKEALKDEVELHTKRLENLEALEEEYVKAEKVAEASKEKKRDTEKKLDKASNRRADKSTNFQEIEGFDESKFRKAEAAYEDFANKQKNVTDKARENSSAFKALTEALNGNEEEAKEYAKAIEEEIRLLKEYDEIAEKAAADASKVEDTKAQVVGNDSENEHGGAVGELEKSRDKLLGKLKDPKTIDVPETKFAEKFTQGAQAVMSFGMAMSSVTGIIDSWSHVAKTGEGAGDALISTFSSLGMTIPSLISGAKALTMVFTNLGTGMATGIMAIASIGLPLLIKGISALVGSAKTVQEQAKEMSESLDGMRQKLEDSKNEYEELKSSLTDYHSARDALKELEVGTTDWKNAVKDLNEQVLELINRYPDLAKWVKNVNGHLELVGEGEKELEQKQEQTIDLNRKIAMFGEVNSGKVNEESKKDTFRNDRLTKENSELWSNAYDETSNVEMNRVQGEDEISQGQLKVNFSSALNKVIDATEKYGTEILKDAETIKNYTNLTELEGKIVEEQIEKFREFIPSIITGREAIETNLQALAETFLEGKDVPEGFMEFLSKKIGEYPVEEKRKEIQEQGEDTLRLKYAQEQHYKEDNITEDDDGNVVFRTKDGQTLPAITDKEIEDFFIYKEAFEEFNNKLPTYEQDFNNFKNSFSDFNEKSKSNLVNFIQTGNLGNGNLTEDDVKELKGVTSEDLQKGANAAGIKNFDAEAKANELQEQLNAIDFSGITENLAYSVAKSFDDLKSQGAFKNIGIQSQKAIADALEDVYTNSGQDAMQKFAQAFKKAQSSGDGEAFADAIESLNGQWDTLKIDDLRKRFSELGVSTDFSNNELQNLIEGMRSSAESFSDVSNQYKEVMSIISGLKEGDTISPEDYDKLTAASEEAQKYFTTMIDGTHQLTGDAQEFYEAIHSELIDKAKDSIKALEEKGAVLNSVKVNKDNPFRDPTGGNAKTDFSFEALSKSQYTDDKSSHLVKYQDQIDIIKALGDESEETQKKVEKFQRILDDPNQHMSKENAEELAEEVGKCKDAYDNLDEVIKQNNIALNQQKIAIAMSAEDLNELNELLKEGTINEVAYAKARDAMYNTERMEGLDSDEIRDYSEHLVDLAESEKETHLGAETLSSDLKNNSEAAKNIAIQIARMNGAVETLADNWEDWSSILKKSSRGSEEYFKASVGVKKALADLFDVSEEYISLDLVDEFAEDKHAMELMAKAAKGDGDAIDELRQKAEDDIIAKIRLDSNINQDAFDELVDPLVKQLEGKAATIKVGADLDDESLMESLNEMIKATGMTEAQVNNLLSGIGFTANFASEDQMVEAKIPINKKHHEVTAQQPVYGPSGQIMAYSYDETETVETIYSDQTTKIPAWAMEAAPPGTRVTPKINKLTKKGGGSVNNYSKSNKGGKGPGKSGGGKGGGGKRQKVQPKNYQDEFDIYGELNHSIKDLDNTLNKLGKQYDYAFGKDRITNLEKQNKAIKQQAAYVKQLAKAEKKEQKKIIGKPKKGKQAATGLRKYGAKFKGDELQNYTQVTTKEWKRWDNARKKYNKGKLSQKDWDAENKRYEKFKKLIERYENVHQKIKEDEEKNRELIRQAIENNFERWQLKVQLKLDDREAKRQWKTFLTKMKASTKDIYGQFNRTSVSKVKNNKNNFNSKRKDLNNLIDQREQLASIATKDGWKAYAKKTKEGDRLVGSMEEAKAKMKELDEQIMQTAEDMENELNEAWSTYIDRLNTTQEEFDLINERLERQGDILEYNRQLIELQYGDKAYQHMSKYYEAEMMYLKQKQSDLKEEKEYWAYEFKEATKAAKKRDSTVNVNNIHTWTQDMVIAYRNMNQAAGDLEQTQLQLVQTAQELYTTQVDNAINQAQIEMYGKSFEEYEEEWERAKEVQDRYLDDTEKLYHMQTLMNKIDQSIASTKNLKNIQKLKKLREDELKKLQEETKLTKYMVDAANARYEIALKEMALEEAKNNKNSMKLSRNEEGNWSYQYVANTDDVLQKQQELRDAEYNLYEISKNEQRDMADQAMEAQRKYWEKTRAAALLCMTDQETGQKKLDAAVKELNEDLEYTNGQLKEAKTNGIAATVSMAVNGVKQNPDDVKKISPEASGIAKDGLAVFGEETTLGQIYEAFGGYGEEAATNFKNGFFGGEDGKDSVFEALKTKAAEVFTGSDTGSFLSKIGEMAAGVDDYLNGKGGTGGVSIADSFKKLYDVIAPSDDENNPLKKYQDSVSGIFDKIDDSISGVIERLGKKGYTGAVSKVVSQSKKDTKKIRGHIEKIDTAWKNATKKVETYKKKVKKIKSKTITITVKYKEVGKPSNYSSSDSGDGGGGNGGGGSNNPSKTPKPKTESKKWRVKIKGSVHKSGFKSKEAAQKYVKNTLMDPIIRKRTERKAKNYTPYLNPEEESLYEAYTHNKFTYEKYKTGGYTGDWSTTKGLDKDGGRFALLHQKELILNKEDTKNMLAAVNTIRDIKNLNSSITDTISESIASIFANSVKNLIGNRIPEKQENEEKSIVIENINAEFPNAQDVDDIREAILSLPRLASQYVSRNLK